MAKFVGKTPGKLRLFWSFKGWFGLIFLIAGAGCLIGASFVGRNAVRLANSGMDVTGTVQGKDLRTSRDTDGRTTSTYYVQFHFDTRTGQRIEDEKLVQYDTYQGTHNGEPIAVRYWPDDPMVNEIEPNANRFLAIILGLIGLPFFLVGAGFALGQARFARNAVRTRDLGERLEATVIEHRASNLRVNDTRYSRLHWRDENGNTGQSQPAHPSKLLDYLPGSKINVYVGSHAPTKGVWEGDVGQSPPGYGGVGRQKDAADNRNAGRPPTVRR